MRTTASILGILGSVFGAMLGIVWIGDANEHADQLEAARQLGANTAELDAHLTAGYLLLVGLVLGITGGVFGFKGKKMQAAGLMGLAAVLPAIWAPKTLAFTFFLVIGAGLMLASKPKN